MTPQEKVVEAIRSQIGQNYFSMNYGSDVGYAGTMGTNYVGAGWGCAQLCAYGFNSTMKTHYLGSVWNFVGDAFGQEVAQGGGQFVTVDTPEIGDVIAYRRRGCLGNDYDDYGHVAIYAGNDRIIGAWGEGTPSNVEYWSEGVIECNINYQSLGNGYIILRNTRYENTQPDEEDEMFCIIQPNDESILWYFDGTTIHPLGHPDEAEAIRKVYRETHNGAEIPSFKLGTKGAPWATRLKDAIKRKL